MLTKELCEKLAIFSSVTELFSSAKYPTANLFFLKVCEIKMSIEFWMRSSNDYVKMMDKFEKY